MSATGSAGVVKGVVGIKGTWGPMSYDVESLVLFLRNVWAENSRMFKDSSVAPIPFQSELYESDRPLSIGYYMSEGSFEVSGILFLAHLRSILKCLWLEAFTPQIKSERLPQSVCTLNSIHN